MKHSPHQGFHQAFRGDCLRAWYASPKGIHALERLHREMAARCPFRFDTTFLELAPVSVVAADRTRGAWVLRAGPGESRLQTEADRLPLASDSFSCVLVAHIDALDAEPSAVIAEAARVLKPEGHLFLLETNVCLASARKRLGDRLPIGFRRHLYRRWIGEAGLEVRHQASLSLLPTRLAGAWPRRLVPFDARLAPWLPLLGNCILTVARRRDTIPLSPDTLRMRWSRLTVRAGGTSQWA